MPIERKTAILAVLVAVLAAAPAEAADVIVVEGDRAIRRADPFAPAPERSRLPASPARASPPRARRRRARPWCGRPPAATARWRGFWRALRAGGSSAVRRCVGCAAGGALDARCAACAAHGTQLAYVLASVERLALERRLIPSRMRVVFDQLERNRRYWRPPLPGAGDRVSFRGSELLFEYFPGRGLSCIPWPRSSAPSATARVAPGADCDPKALSACSTR